MNPLEDKKAYKLRIYDQNKKFLEILRFDDINKLENFIGELIKNDYKIDNVESTTASYHYNEPKPFAPEFPRESHVEILWFFNKKDGKYYSLQKNEQTRDIFNFLISFYKNPKESSLLKEIGFLEYKKQFNKKKASDEKRKQ